MQRVHKSFGSQKVLRGVDLVINPQDSFVLLGRSGSGKSVLLKCLLGLMPFDHGIMEMEGQPLLEESSAQQYERMARIGMVFQGSALFDSLSVWENVVFRILMTRVLPLAEARKLALATLERVGLQACTGDLLPSELSGGMQRRVALARAIALKPPFLFLDEPTAGLDPVFSRLIGALIQDCRRSLKAVTLTLTHDLDLARTIADRIGLLHEGEIVWQGTPEELSTTAHPLVREFVG
jgi:phospholipid/cholesterol/gamma-HCH transport system ATP-binding protein